MTKLENLYNKIVIAMENHISGYLDKPYNRIVLDMEVGYLFYYKLTGRLSQSVPRREKITSNGQYGTVYSEFKVYYDQNADDKFRLTNEPELNKVYNQIISE